MSTRIELNPQINTRGLYSQTVYSSPVTTPDTEETLIGTGLGFLSVPANNFKAGDMFRIVMHGRVECQNNTDLQLVIRSNTSVFLNTVVSMVHSSGNPWRIDAEFIVQSIGTSGVAAIQTAGMFNYMGDASSTFAGFMFDNLENNTFDTTVTNTLDITATWISPPGPASIYTSTFNLLKIY